MIKLQFPIFNVYFCMCIELYTRARTDTFECTCRASASCVCLCEVLNSFASRLLYTFRLVYMYIVHVPYELAAMRVTQIILLLC